MTAVIVNFDECLWIKAMEVMCADNEGALNNVIIPYTRFYTLMPFFWIISEFIGGSEMGESLNLVFAENIVSHILTETAYSSAFNSKYI